MVTLGVHSVGGSLLYGGSCTMLYLELRSLAFLNSFFTAGSFFAVNSGSWHTTEVVQEHVNSILSRAQQSW